MRRMRKSRLYRVGSALLAAVIVFTGVPQIGISAFAAEELMVEENDEAQTGASKDTSGETDVPTDPENDPESGTKPEKDLEEGDETGDAETKPEEEEDADSGEDLNEGEAPKPDDPGNDESAGEEGTKPGEDEAEGPADDSDEGEMQAPEDTEASEEQKDGSDTILEEEEILNSDETSSSVKQPKENSPEEFSAYSAFKVNPLYEDILDADELKSEINKIQKEAAAGASLYDAKESAEVFQNAETAAVYLRGQMLERSTTVNFYLPKDLIPSQEAFKALMEEMIEEIAFEYTPECTGQEGDALALGCKGYGYKAEDSGDGNYLLTCTIAYWSDSAQEQELTAEVDKALASLDLETKTEYQKIRSIYDFICDHVNYDQSLQKHAAYDALCTKTAVCQGYAVLFYRMCKDAGLSVRAITGKGYGEAHVWNIIRLGDKYYNVDATWDGQDEETRHDYFLLSEKDFINHERAEKFATDEFYEAYPMAGISYIDESDFEESYEKNNLEGITFETIDGETISNAAEGKSKVLIFFSPDDANSQATIQSVAQQGAEIGLTGIDILAVAVAKQHSSISKETVQSFKGSYGGNNITFAHDEKGENGGKLYQYVNAVTGKNTWSYPVVCYIDVNNKFQYLTQMLSNASKIKANLDHYCQAVSDPAAGDAEEYSIIYELDGGINPSGNPAVYKASELPVTLEAPSKTGFNFLGWYTDAAFNEANKVTEIAAGTTGAITLYAKWEAQSAKYKIKAPAKSTYLTGEVLDLTDGKILDADENEVADLKENMISGFSSDQEGVVTVQATYDGEQLSFDVLVIAAPTGLTMKLDEMLSDISLPKSQYGSWAWNNPSEKPDETGSKTFMLEFVPANTTKFETRTGISVTVAVSKRNVVISGVTANDKIYDGLAYAYSGNASLHDAAGSAISGNVSLTASYNGICADGSLYNESAVSPVNAGSYTLMFKMAGTDADLYNLTGTASYSFKINKRTLEIIADSFEIDADQDVPAPTFQTDGLVTGEQLTSDPDFHYSPALTQPLKPGQYVIQPGNAGASDNYEIQYKNGLLKVTGDDPTVDNRERFTVEFDRITVEDSNYSGKKHSISGYPLWSHKETPLSCHFQVTGKTSEGDSYDESTDADITYSGVIKEFKDAYSAIAPVKCGSYTLEITVEVDEDIFNYTGSGFRADVYILRLQKYETKLVGVTGIEDKFYDGTPVDFSGQIKAAKAQSNRGEDLEDAVLEFGIRGTTAGSETEDYNVTVSPSNPSANMPSAAGSYTLWVKLVGTKNYLENVWEFPFAIKQKALTVTVEDKKIPVHADGSLVGGYTYIITDADGNILSNDDFGKPVIAPVGEVDTTKPGEYELVVSGDIAGGDYDVVFVSGKLFIQAQLWGVKEPNLTRTMNVPNGMSLAEIAGEYLPETVTIYLDQEKQIEDTAAVEWDTEKPYTGSYNDKNESPQSFQMKGTVVLPDLVYVEEAHKDWLTVIVDIRVREADKGAQASKPYANVQPGVVGEGTRVSLYTEEPDPGAKIYYTVEAENPSLSINQKLYNEPIEVKCTMTIRAVTRVYGKKDSDELRLVYYFDTNYDPDGPVDPDDPDNPGVSDEDIPKDDNGNPLPIPEGLWVTDVDGYTYSGKAIKPAVRVYDHKKRLEEKKDYTVSYKNNVNAADKNSAKAPTITIKGKGNYEGTLLKTFTIAPKNISDPDVKADDLTVAYNNKRQTPSPTVTWSGRKLKNKKDYSFKASPQTETGSYKIKVRGIGNYTGERNVSFIISNAKPAAKLTVGKLPACTYTGKAIEPKPVVKSGKEVLQEMVDYTLSYEDNVEIGTASVLVKGAGRFAGVKRVTFQIKEAAVLNKAKAELQFTTPTIYTGKEITASKCLVTVQVQADGSKQERTLVEDKDFRVTYQNNVKAGKATAVIEGINEYRGTLKKTFKITPYELPLDRNKLISIKTKDAYPYMKGGSTPKPVITFDGKTLKEGTDYTVSYKNNKTAGSPATMTIKGKGNFTGSVARGFHVEVQDLSKMSVKPVDKVFRNKANIYKTTIRVYDTNGKQLSAGRDYGKTVTYTYAKGTKLLNDVERKADDAVMPTDVIPAGTAIKVTVTAAGANYQGTAVGEYKIVQSDISKAKVTIPKQTYTGKPIELKETDFTVLMNGVVVPADEYKIVSYSNNVNKGTAKLTIQGQGNFGGTKTVSFQIKGKNLLGQIFG